MKRRGWGEVGSGIFLLVMLGLIVGVKAWVGFFL